MITSKRIRISYDAYNSLDILRKQYGISFSKVIEMYIPMPQFFIDTNAILPPVVKYKVKKTIPKKKYNPTADLEEFNKNKSKTLGIQPMRFDRKVKVDESEYNDKTKAYIEETDGSIKYKRKYLNKRNVI